MAVPSPKKVWVAAVTEAMPILNDWVQVTLADGTVYWENKPARVVALTRPSFQKVCWHSRHLFLS